MEASKQPPQESETQSATIAYLESRRRFLKYLGRLTGDGAVAEDLLHESFANVLMHRCDGEAGGFHIEQIGIMALRMAHRFRRRARKEKTGEPGREDARVGDFCNGGEGGARLALLRAALRKVPSQELALLRMRYEASRTILQISRDEGITKAAVTARLKRARARIRAEVLRLESAVPPATMRATGSRLIEHRGVAEWSVPAASSRRSFP